MQSKGSAGEWLMDNPKNLHRLDLVGPCPGGSKSGGDFVIFRERWLGDLGKDGGNVEDLINRAKIRLDLISVGFVLRGQSEGRGSMQLAKL